MNLLRRFRQLVPADGRDFHVYGGLLLVGLGMTAWFGLPGLIPVGMALWFMGIWRMGRTE